MQRSCQKGSGGRPARPRHLCLYVIPLPCPPPCYEERKAPAVRPPHLDRYRMPRLLMWGLALWHSRGTRAAPQRDKDAGTRLLPFSSLAFPQRGAGAAPGMHACRGQGCCLGVKGSQPQDQAPPLYLARYEKVFDTHAHTQKRGTQNVGQVNELEKPKFRLKVHSMR